MRFKFKNSIELDLFEVLHFFKDSIFFLILSIIYFFKILFYSNIETINEYVKFSIIYLILSVLLYTRKKCSLKYKILQVKKYTLDFDNILELLKDKKWTLQTRHDNEVVFRTPISYCGNSMYRGGEFVYLKIIDDKIYYRSIYNYYSISFVFNINESKLNEEFIYNKLNRKYPNCKLIKNSCLIRTR